MGLNVGVGCLEVFLYFFKVLLVGETVQDDIEIALGEGVGNTQSDSAQ
jgi:hypothetical protein